ncbi:WD40 repeat domain-containing serine/threonine protein kinase [Streptomyces sp. NPDC059783]|uniref:WD40 repeat domain-containing serine/threonine protein kinase n=1 Tax=Streptomyces sp. NPDC059783 TaxID=3346944 RepID=UPI003666C2F9
MPDPLLPGDPSQLGPYYLDGRLGAGGQGVVYEGYGPDGVRVAVKALHGMDDGDRARLSKEVRAWKRVDPFCTAQVFHADLDASVPYVVSEYVSGRDLRRAVDADGPYGPEALRRLAIGVATALVAVHRADVVHRDLKPENILLGPDGPRVIDFGIARVMEGTATAGLPMGTLRYMPPERYRGEHGDGKVDVWGWGAVVLFAATGRHAFDAHGAMAVTYQVATHEPDTSALAEPLRSLVTASLAKDPAGRPTSEQLLLALVGRADLAEVVTELAAEGPSEPVPPSRAEQAETVFGALDPRAQEAVPQVLLRLVAAGERAEDTLRSARRVEFSDGRTPDDVLDRVLRAFTEAEVLSWEDGCVTLSGPALIRSWPRLRDWVEAERAGLGVHQRLAEGARTWDEHGRRKSDLPHGTALHRARNWAATGRRHVTLNRVENAYLEAGAELERRRGRTRVLVSAVLAVLLVVAVGAAGYAFDQRQTVAGQRDRAASAQVAGVAQSVRRSDPRLARRLAVASASLGDTPQSWSVLAAVSHQQEADAVKLPDFVPAASALDTYGRTLASATDTRVEFWNVDARTRTGAAKVPGRVHHVGLSGDGRTAAVSAEDGTTRLFDTAGGGPHGQHVYRTPLEESGAWPWVELSPQGTYLLIETTVSDSRRTLEVWDTRTARLLRKVTGDDSWFPLASASFSPDERIFSFRDPERGLTWIDPHTGKNLPVRLPADRAKAEAGNGQVVFSPDGKSAAMASYDGKVSVFDLVTRHPGPVLTGGKENSAHPLRFSRDSRSLVQDGVLWDAASIDPSPLMRYDATENECFAGTPMGFTRDGTKLRCAGTDGVVRSFDVSAFTRPPAPVRGNARYTKGSVSPDLRSVALQDGDIVEVRSLPGRAVRSTVSLSDDFSPYVNALRLSGNGKRLAVVVTDGVGLWDTSGAAGASLGRLDAATGAGGDRGVVTDAAFSPDGRSLAVLTFLPDKSKALTFWDVRTLRRIREVRAPRDYTGDAGTVLFRPDGKSVVVAPDFGLVAFPSGRIVDHAPSGLNAALMNRDGTRLYAPPEANRPFVRTWDADTLRPLGDDLRTGPATADAVSGAVSPDGRLLATVHEAGTRDLIKVWDTRTGAQFGVSLTGGADEIVALSFTADGSSLVSVDKGGTFTARPLEAAGLARRLCAVSGPLTEEEWKEYVPDVPYRKTC